MVDLRKTVRVHPTTVTKFSEGTVGRLVRRPSRDRRRGEMDAFIVHPFVWKTALGLCSGEVGRIEVISDKEVIVHNNRGWRTKVR